MVCVRKGRLGCDCVDLILGTVGDLALGRGNNIVAPLADAV